MRKSALDGERRCAIIAPGDLFVDPRGNTMSQKAICPRGHIWDPSMLGGLPPSETPRCPICGEEESLRASKKVARLGRWCRNNPALAVLLTLCLLFFFSLIVTIAWARTSLFAARQQVEQAQSEAQWAEAKLQSSLRAKEKEETQRRQRETEIQAGRWNTREKEFQAQLREAEKAARAYRQQRDDRIQASIALEERAKTADQVRQEALRSRAEAARQLVKLYVAAGTRRMESNDLSASLLWFLEALRLAKEEHLPPETHRLRLAAVLAQCPRPVQLWSHDKTLNAVQLSADGKRVLTAGANGAAEVWDTTTGKRIAGVLAHAEAVTHAAFNPDGKRVLTASADGMLHLWDVETSKGVVNAVPLMGPVIGLAFSPDSKRFLIVTDKVPMGAMGPTEVELHIRDATTAEAIREASLGSELSPRLASFSPEGRQVLTVCQDRCARIWDIATGKQIGSAFTHEAPLVQASFRPDGERVLTASTDGVARVWQTKSGEPVTPFFKHGSVARGARFSPGGRYVVTFDDEYVRVWDTDKGESLGPRLRHAETVNDARFSPDGRYVLTTCADGAARLWDYRTGQEILSSLRHGESIRYAAFTPAGDGVLTQAGRVVRLWDLTASEVSSMGQPSRLTEGADLVVFSPDGKRALRVTETAVRVYDTAKNEPVGATLPHKNKVSAAVFSPDGKRLLTISHQPNGDELEGHLRVWETETGQLLGQPLIHPRSVLEASFNRDGRRILTACQDGKARLWDVDKNALLGEPMEHKTDLQRAVFLPDGKRLLTVDVEGGLRLWDADKAEAVGPIWGYQKPIHHLAFSADGQFLVTASTDGTARVWEANTGHERAMTPLQDAPLVYAAFRPDAKRIVTVGGDRQVRVWDAATGKPMSPPLRHRTVVSLAAFSADGNRLVTVAADGVRVWDASGEPIGPPIRVPTGQSAVHDVALGRDGRLVVSFGASGDPAARWIGDLRPDERSVSELARVAELLSAERMADAGETTPLDRAALLKAWQDVHTKYAKEFAPSAEREAAWHRRAASECENRQMWKGAFVHLDYLISAKPSTDLYARRGQANAKLRRWAAANSDYSKALAGNEERWDLWAGRAEVEAALGHRQEALADYSKAIERKSDRAALWTACGRLEAEGGDWKKAAADLGKAIHLGETDVTLGSQHLLALLASGDAANYQRGCARLVQRFGDSKDEAIARRVAWTCALAEGAVRDWKSLRMRAERMVTAHPQSADALRLFAVLSYRAGQYDQSLKQSQKLTNHPDLKPQARDWLLMALAGQRLGRSDEAKQWLAQAEEARSKEKNDKESWEYRLVYQTLHREAEMLVKGNKP
jgi:WD40 repeat protein/tetratricopeptide (TPR) repeat protein